MVTPFGNHRQNDIVMLLVELEDDLHAGDFLDRTVFDGLCGTEKIHRFQRIPGHDADILDVEACCFLLKQNLHLWVRDIVFLV